MSPGISVIMPCLNGAQHLQQSVDSVLGQSRGDFELLVIDNGSTDRSLEILAAMDDPRIRVLQQPEKGVSRARNLGLAQARGAFIAFLDCDDTWTPDFLEKMSNALESDPSAVLAYCGWQNLGLPGPRGAPFIPPDYQCAEKSVALLGGCRWPIHGCISRAEAIQAAGGFNPELIIAEDYLLWMEVAIQGKILRVPEVLAFYHHHAGPQATRNRARGALDTLLAKELFLSRHPEVAMQIPPNLLEALTWGKLIEEGNTLYWRGDYESARPLFRKALSACKGRPRELLRMLPSLLPLGLHRALGKAKQRFGG